MRTLLKVFVVLLGVAVVLVAGVYLWAGYASGQRLARVYETHRVDFPIPFAATAEELAAAGVTEDTDGALALARARERGRHLVESRYHCVECHGENFGGGVMVDAFPMGRFLGPNLTAGRGGVTAGYTPADWDRAVRHGVLRDGRPSIMPAQDFLRMSDQELSDVIAYIQSQPPVDNEVPKSSLGPLGKVLVATGQLNPPAEAVADHQGAHPLAPPPAGVTAEFGGHLAGTCVGCHGMNLAGGPIVGGDPSWPPARNLTPHETGLRGWTYDQFVTAFRQGTRPDGTKLLPPMTLVLPYAQSMTDVEMQAIWAYLQSLPPTPLPQ
jgi:mono/diheme cytochrome c family protein